jgi:hypothetical protein
VCHFDNPTALSRPDNLRRLLQSIEVIQSASIITMYSTTYRGRPIIERRSLRGSHVSSENGSLKTYISTNEEIRQVARVKNIPKQLARSLKMDPRSLYLIQLVLQLPPEQLDATLVEEGVTCGRTNPIPGCQESPNPQEISIAAISRIPASNSYIPYARQ